MYMMIHKIDTIFNINSTPLHPDSEKEKKGIPTRSKELKNDKNISNQSFKLRLVLTGLFIPISGKKKLSKQRNPKKTKPKPIIPISQN